MEVQLSKTGIAKHAMNSGRIDYLNMVIQDTREYMSELSAVAKEYREIYKTARAKGLDCEERYFHLWKSTEGKLSESRRYLTMFERTRAGYEWELNNNG